ncbi:hypothetical protein FJZ27_05170 [Candidatus Peribacteria bacterium]|nr:hypothetical protein [Candidatus Peribacteria bacterium]
MATNAEREQWEQQWALLQKKGGHGPDSTLMDKIVGPWRHVTSAQAELLFAGVQNGVFELPIVSGGEEPDKKE